MLYSCAVLDLHPILGSSIRLPRFAWSPATRDRRIQALPADRLVHLVRQVERLSKSDGAELTISVTTDRNTSWPSHRPVLVKVSVWCSPHCSPGRTAQSYTTSRVKTGRLPLDGVRKRLTTTCSSLNLPPRTAPACVTTL